jgi:hypothetical protein
MAGRVLRNHGAVALPVAAPEQELLDFGAFDLKVTSIKEISGFRGEKGNTIKASRRDARLVEVELTGRANATGEFALYPMMFSALCNYRGVANVFPARAIGTKIKNRITGKVTEYWYNEPGVSVIIGMNEGETIRRHHARFAVRGWEPHRRHPWVAQFPLVAPSKSC